MEYSEQAVPQQVITGVSDRGLRSSLLISQGLAFFFWLVALFVRASNVTPVWFDQENTFTKALYHLADPQQIYQFRNPPWTAILLAPVSVLPLSFAVLIQLCLYFAILWYRHISGIPYREGIPHSNKLCKAETNNAP